MELKSIEKPKVLVVEGDDDEDFFSALSGHLGIKDIQIVNCKGKDRIRPTIKTITLETNFYKIKSLCVIRDADNYPDRVFQSICDALKNVDLDVPQIPFEITGRKPKVAVMILPDGKTPGELEDLCLKALENDPAMECVKQYFDCLEKRLGIVPQKLSKAQMLAFCASREDAVRTLGIASLAGYLPWDSPVFNQIKRILNEL